ncbi:MAG: 3-hydroxyacyl-ACP dehydratase FabZ [Candidatus Aminicenantales bacterium]
MPLNPEKSKVMNIEDILKFLPHRYPFLLVDRVLELEKGKFIKALKNVTYNEHFFQGHFPQKRIMPGVLVVEAMAQTGGILLYHTLPDSKDKIFFMSKIDEVKFRRPVLPGDQLILSAEIVKLKGNFCLVRGKAKVDGEIVAEGEIMAYVTDYE